MNSFSNLNRMPSITLKTLKTPPMIASNFVKICKKEFRSEETSTLNGDNS